VLNCTSDDSPDDGAIHLGETQPRQLSRWWSRHTGASMAMSIKTAAADELARSLAELTGETMT
jgi:hypothetical protein